ncbi:MAG: helix-turn-helix transcriptional regulator [Actinobacteria bacterium]|nr:helix-turn-helix transcriptional regulator [Actinomycetota bacterium]
MSVRIRNLFSPQSILPLLGLTCSLAWVYSILLSPEPFYMYHHLGFGVGLLLIAYLYSRNLGTADSKLLDCLAVVFMCAVPLRSLIPAFTNEAALVAIAFLSGVAVGHCFSKLFKIFCTFESTDAINYTLIAFMLSAGIRFMLVMLMEISRPITLVLIGLLPFITLVCCWNASRYIVEPATWKSKAGELKSLFMGDTLHLVANKGLLAGIVIYGLLFGLMHYGVTDWHNATVILVVGHVLRIIFPLLLLIWFNKHHRTPKGATTLRTTILLLVFILLVAVFFGDAVSIVAPALILTARNFVTTLLYVMLFRFVYETDAHPCVVFGVGRALYELAMTLGLFVYSQPFFQRFFDGLSENIVYFVMACIFLLMMDSFARMTQLLQGRNDNRKVEIIESVSIDTKCDEIKGRYELTDRETEVMKLLCKGQSKKQIAEKLFLSENTISFHTKQLYRKLSIHSKEELQKLIGFE